MEDQTISLTIVTRISDLENLNTRLEIVADHCDTGNHSPMVGTIYEAIEIFKNAIDSAKQK